MIQRQYKLLCIFILFFVDMRTTLTALIEDGFRNCMPVIINFETPYVTKQNFNLLSYTYIFTCIIGFRFLTFLAFTICITILTLLINTILIFDFLIFFSLFLCHQFALYVLQTLGTSIKFTTNNTSLLHKGKETFCFIHSICLVL